MRASKSKCPGLFLGKKNLLVRVVGFVYEVGPTFNKLMVFTWMDNCGPILSQFIPPEDLLLLLTTSMDYDGLHWFGLNWNIRTRYDNGRDITFPIVPSRL